jgi:hypothetical protein
MTKIIKNKTYLPAIALLAILLLGAFGFGYAMWSETLTLNGKISTGKLCWKIKGPYGYDNGHNDMNSNCTWGGPWNVGKDIANTTLSAAYDTDGDGCPDTLNVTIVNAYPWYMDEISFYFENCGTIPLKFTKALIDGHEVNATSGRTVFLDLDHNGTDDVKVRFGNGFGQYEPYPTEPYDNEVSLSILILQKAPQDAHNLSFTITMVATNWNDP